MLHSTLTGWWGVEDSFDWDELPPHRARDDAERFHDGGPSFFGAVAMAAAIDIIESEGMVVYRCRRSWRTPELSRMLSAGRRRGAGSVERRCRAVGDPVVPACPDEPATVTMQRLDEAEITVSLRGDWLRAAPHASTDPAVFDVSRRGSRRRELDLRVCGTKLAGSSLEEI